MCVRSRCHVFNRIVVAAILGFLCWLEPAALCLGWGQQETEDTVVADEPIPGSDVDEPDAAADESSRSTLAPAVPNRVSPTAKNPYAVPDPALELADPRTYRLKVVIRIEAPEAPARGIVATGPVPMEWPEQKVRLLSEKRSPGSQSSESVLKGQAALLKFRVSQIPKGGSAFVERLYEITRYRTKFLLPADKLKLPRTAPPELKAQLLGMAPGVQTKDPKMIALAESLRKSNEDAGAWETARSFWKWTRDNVKFENGDFRGALSAIENRCGDCEEMSALFVGLCRLSNIPARTVWVESHDYPEFYLVDDEGHGHWIPAQVLGPAWFGEMAEYRPIFQKGDRFYDELKKEYVRYVPQTVRGIDAKVAPKVEFKHEIIADSDINGPSYNSTR